MANGEMQEKLRAWFQRTGFPLEIETARAYFANGFGVEHSAVYPDPETKKSREIDVLAYGGDETGICSVLFPIECKSSDKPWVVLTNPERYSGYGGMWIAAMSPKAREAASASFQDYVRSYQESFGPTTGGFSLKHAFAGEADHAYTACMSTLKAADALVADEKRIVFAFPTLIVDSPIFECSEGVNDEPVFTQVAASSFSFSAHLKEYSRATIRIVSSAALPVHAARCRALLEEYRALFSRQTKSLFRGGT